MRSSPSHALTARVFAALALLTGSVTLLGWALGMPALVQIRPIWTPMVVNTGIGFVLGASALFAALHQGRRLTGIALLLASVVTLLGLEELLVLALDLSPALSLPDLHRPLQPTYPHPGRMAANTAVCFVLLGTGLLASVRPRPGFVVRWPQRAAISMMAIGGLGLVGYALDLEYLYGWTGIASMAVHTALAMIFIGVALWNLQRARAGARPITAGTEVARVQRTATLLLALVAASAGIGGFSALQALVQHQVREELQRMAADRIVLFEQLIQHRSVRAGLAGKDQQIVQPMRTLAGAPGDPTALAALHAGAGVLLGQGFSSVRAQFAGREWQLAGDTARPRLALDLRGHPETWLLWQDGYLLRRVVPVRDAAGPVGALVTEQRLDVLDATSAATNQLGESTELALCGADASTLHCFPMRSQEQPFRVPRSIAGQPLPMDYALRGQRGTIISRDYRQYRVLAAFGPLGDTGLGLVVKRDVTEIYAPIRRQFQLVAAFLAALLLFGAWLMRRRLNPLLRALEDSRALAVASAVRFEAAVESNLDSFFVLECVRDAGGMVRDMRYVLMNAPAERTLDRPRDEVIGHGMCDMFPALRDDGMLANCVRVAETGEPLVEERQSVVWPDRWYHMQIVRLGDGVGLTVRDITAERLAAEQIRHQALHDPLTGAVNRTGFELALAAALGRSQKGSYSTALALLDVDNFKAINDSLGHAAGDHVLAEVARRLRDCLRPSDTVARLGGDEFALVLPDIDFPEGAEVVARKLIAEFAQPLHFDGQDVPVTLSIGICGSPAHGADGSTLLKCADGAMYRAKHAGRNGYVVLDPASTPPPRS